MNNFLNAVEKVNSFTTTENGAVALSTTGNAVLDAFGSLGAMTNSNEEVILSTFYRAFNESQELAMRLLFYMRDIRGGQGMRRVFRVIIKDLADKSPKLILANLDNFLFFGRGDDVLCLLDTTLEQSVYDWIRGVLAEDIKSETPSMLAKWLPSENTSSKTSRNLARRIAEGLGFTPRKYRKILVMLRRRINIVETLMSQNRWDEIQFDKLPSRAAMIYRDAFYRHVSEKYLDYLKELAAGKAKVNANTLFPVDIIHKVNELPYKPKNLVDVYLLDAMWKALPNYFGDTEETGLCVVDVSGSMLGTPMEVAISLGLYCADKAKGPFKDHFITFSRNPKLQHIIGDNVIDKVRLMERSDWGMNTDLEAVFDLILEAAEADNLPQEDLPSKLYIISDMQFDRARSDGWSSKPRATFMQHMKQRFADAGYTMPAIVYWNVRASECGMFQERFEGENVAMVSGYSPSLFEAVIRGTDYVTEEIVTETGETKTVVKQTINPMEVMLRTLMSERYDRVVTM